MKLFLRQWQVAFRKGGSANILSDKETPFVTVPNTYRYTAADPFLFNYGGKKYLFAEILDKKDCLGKIGYSVFDGEKFSEWKIIISENYHLSYPNIFEYNGEIFIIPESNQSETVYAYKAVEFPKKWEKCDPILTGIKCVDTTFLDFSGKHYMFTYDIGDDEHKKLLTYEIDTAGKTVPLRCNPVSENDFDARHGGNFICINGDIIRVSQDCDGDYGKALVFSRVEKCDILEYKETVLERVYPGDIKINASDVTGIHTYNSDGELEVIDIHVPDHTLYTQVRRVLRKLK